MKACDFSSLVPECCTDVLDAMYFTSVDSFSLAVPPPVSTGGSAELITYDLQFTGDISGVFGLQLGLSTARSLSENFLGEMGSDLSSTEIHEVVGELANMLCGSIMSRVEGKNPFALSHPEASTPEAADNQDILFTLLETDSGPITVWISLKVIPCQVQ